MPNARSTQNGAYVNFHDAMDDKGKHQYAA